MANTKISALPTYTGDTTGVYLVMDNSGLTQSYKVAKETLNSLNPWTNAGTIDGVGWGATTTPPTIGTSTRNNIKYRKIANKEWEVFLTYGPAFTGNANGSGDYIFTLPNGLSWDITIPGQVLWTYNVGESSWQSTAFAIPASGLITNSVVGGQAYPVPYGLTTYRILTTTYGTGIQFWGSGFYGVGGVISLNFNFIST